MHLLDFGERVVRNAFRIPLLGSVMKRDHERAFFRGEGGHYSGIYRSFAEAARAIPAAEKTGFDHAAAAALYRKRMLKACESDYGPLFWMQRILRPDSFVFDFGGHVGVSYHGWKSYLDYGKDLRWMVYDMPAVIRVGAEIARETESDSLSFTHSIADGRGCSIFLTAGVIQYLDRSLASVLRELGELPEHLVINKTPLYDGAPYVTIQSAGKAFHPYHVYNREEFVSELVALGYRVVDSWTSAEQTCLVPFTKGKDVEAYSGFYMVRDEATGKRGSAQDPT